MSSLVGRGGMPRATGASVSPLGQTGYSAIQFPQLSPEQYNLFSQLLGGTMPGIGAGLGGLSKLAGGDQSQFQSLEAPALRQHQALLGNLGARFSGMGTGAQRSSGFQQAAGAATTDLAERLASQRMGLQRQALQDLLGLGRDLLGTKLTETALIPEQQQQSNSPLQELLLGLLPALGGMVGGPIGSFGATLASGLGSHLLKKWKMN